MKKPTPKTTTPVTVLVPTYNEQSFIIDCLDSIIEGDYPLEAIEILVIDGNSTDSTAELVTSYSKKHPFVKLLSNDKKIVPAAINIGLESASHNVILWVGAHGIYSSDYIINSVRVLKEEKCASVGGVITPVGKTKIGRAIAVATTSKFGIGNAKYRYATKRQSVDTVFGGCWNKDDALSIGGFNEKWTRNQDYEFNCRLRENIGEIILDPSIRCTYFCRETIRGLAKQYFQYGFWRFHTFKEHSSSFTVRQAAPLLLLFGTLLSVALLILDSKVGYLIPVTYLSIAILCSLTLSVEHKTPSYIFLLPIIFATLHFFWAFGFVKSASYYLFKKTMSFLDEF